MSIDDLLSYFNSNGVARLNRFRIDIPLPTSLLFLQNDLNIDKSYTLNLLCDTTGLPGTTISTSEYGAVRNTIKIPQSITHDDIEFSFYLDGSMTPKKIFEAWVDLVVNKTTFRTAYLRDIVSDIVVQNLDAEGSVMYGVKLIDAYPIGIPSITMSNDLENIEKMAVTFTFARVIPYTGE